MKTAQTIAEMKCLRNDWATTGSTVGFVPTMGALHRGHASLIERAGADGGRVVVSIFVNPTQFNDPKDFWQYPKSLNEDLELLRQLEVDALFLPQAQEIYQDQFRFEVHENKFSQILCGPKRPGHFTGVLTVVLKLLNIVEPTRAFFGEKDYQQFHLLRQMAQAFFLKTEIVGCPTVRERDGLALSSRNTRLTAEQREVAPQLYRILRGASSAHQAELELDQAGFSVDYVEEHFGRRFIAAFLGDVRLIDNDTF